jgi:hypothetical protein
MEGESEGFAPYLNGGSVCVRLCKWLSLYLWVCVHVRARASNNNHNPLDERHKDPPAQEWDGV